MTSHWIQWKQERKEKESDGEKERERERNGVNERIFSYANSKNYFLLYFMRAAKKSAQEQMKWYCEYVWPLRLLLLLIVFFSLFLSLSNTASITLLSSLNLLFVNDFVLFFSSRRRIFDVVIVGVVVIVTAAVLTVCGSRCRGDIAF